jgi:polysaccharide deacetylase 2 family uncharacterized protein YibQ
MRQKKSKILKSAAILLLITFLGVFYVMLIQDRESRKQPRPFEEKQRDTPKKGTSYRAGQSFHKLDREPSKVNILPTVKKVAILIDDIGYDFPLLHELIMIDEPLTFAILPYYPHSVDAARLLHAKGREIILHLPMEPHSYPDEQPGVGALFLTMSNDQIRKQIEEDIAMIPFVSGVNNHMGSRFMEDEAKLLILFNYLKKRNLFFIDSRTTPSSRAKEIAKKSGVAFISRKIFIDAEHNYRTTLQNLMQLSVIAYEQSSEPILAIGHPYPDTIRALRKAIPALKAEGVVIVPVSDLFK